jgi:hypothetical protein
LKKLLNLLTGLTLVLSMMLTPISAHANENLTKDKYEQKLKRELQKTLDTLNETVNNEMEKINFTEEGYYEFDVVYDDGHISTVTIENVEVPSIIPLYDVSGTHPIETYKSYTATVTVNSPFASQYAGGSLVQKINYNTLGTGTLSIIKLSYVSTSMEATPPQACAIVDKNSTYSSSTSNEYNIFCNGYVTIQTSGSWTVFVNVYTQMELQAYTNSIGIGLNYSL